MTNFTMICRDRYNLTRQALDSLASSTTADMTVTIVDDRSVEPTSELLYTWSAYRNDRPMGTGTLRNLVVRASENRYKRGDYLYLSDNDVFFMSGWLPNLIACYEDVWDRGYRVVGGYCHPYNQACGPMEFIYRKPILNVYPVLALATQSMLMRWEVFDEFGPFIDTPVDRVCQSEDVVFSTRIRDAGFKLGVVAPWLIANTGITNSFGEHIPGWELVKQQAPAGVIVE